jgi:cobalt-zinc-cadmium efflux system outer membrane protein
MAPLPRAAGAPWSFVICVLAVAAGPPGAGAEVAAAAAGQQTARPGAALTEGEALRVGLADPAFARFQAARVDLARSELLEARLAPNPELGLSYESGDGIGDPAETTLRLSRTFDTSGRRRLREHGAAARLASAHAQGDGERLERRAQVLTRFYTALHEQERAAVLRAWDTRIGAAAQIVSDRAGAGEASGYDLRRLEHEQALARAERHAAAGRLAQARAALLALLDGDQGRYGDLVGRILPATPPPLEALADRLDRRPDLIALRQREEAARLSQRAGERAAIPDVTVGLGAKHIGEADRDDWGLVLEVSVPLGLSDRGQAAVARADAESRVIAGEYQLAVREAQGSLRGLWQKAIELQRGASRLQATDVPQARSLAQTARSGYQAGEIGILELLDAQRTVKETEMRGLDLALEARLTTVELERISGGTEP